MNSDDVLTSMYGWCKCHWPESMRSDVNRCIHCALVIPVDEADMSQSQIETRQKFISLGISWPKWTAKP